MEETIYCYGIKLKFGIIQIEQIDFDQFGKIGFDYQVGFRTVFNSDVFGTIELVILKEGKEIKSFEWEGWKAENLKIHYTNGETELIADVTDCIGECQTINIYLGKGSKSIHMPSKEDMLKSSFYKLKKLFETYGSIDMYYLCEILSINFYGNSLGDYSSLLKLMYEFSDDVETIRKRLKKSPEVKDQKAYVSVLKPKLIEYMEKLSKVNLDIEKLNP